MLIRIGLPLAGGHLAAAARRLGAPVLISANALSRPWPRKHRGEHRWPGFRQPSAALAGLDVALDSAGFVAMSRYRGYPWPVDAYVRLAGAHPWSWWAAMDLCCEPEIARDRDEVQLRIAGTCRLLSACRRAAGDLGVTPPTPVLQGWLACDFVRCADRLPLLDWPDLVGLGSMCRRRTGGLDGIVAVVDRLDQVLPAHVRLHLFGVKSAAIAALAGHPRIASTDSQAWDFTARKTCGAANDMAHRARCMQTWYARQRQHLRARAPAITPSLPFEVPCDGDLFDEAWFDLVAAGEIDPETVNPQRLWESRCNADND